MKGGKIVERGPADQVFGDPQCDYTRELISAALDFGALGAAGSIANRRARENGNAS